MSTNAIDLEQSVKRKVAPKKTKQKKLQVMQFKEERKKNKNIGKKKNHWVNMDIWHWVKFLITSLRHRPY